MLKLKKKIEINDMMMFHIYKRENKFAFMCTCCRASVEMIGDYLVFLSKKTIKVFDMSKFHISEIHKSTRCVLLGF